LKLFVKKLLFQNLRKYFLKDVRENKKISLNLALI
jgi:hypothetical protein